MKKELLMSCVALLTLAVAQAASVSTSNTVALVKKEAVIANGYQLLVVPVADMDITQGDNHSTAIAIADMLPPAKYNGYQITTVESKARTFSCDGTTWVGASDTDTTLTVGTVFWLRQSSARTGGEPLSEVIFCGNVQPAQAELLSGSSGGVTALGNASTAAIKITDLKAPNGGEIPDGAQLLCLKNGSTEYESYEYKKGTWYQWVEETDPVFGDKAWVQKPLSADSALEIVPAEAFYYYVP